MAESPADGERRDFFVSYTAVDRSWAEWIAWQLEDAGYTVLLQAWDMVPGTNWLRMMNQAVRFAERTIAVLSAAYLDSVFAGLEWQAALRRDPAGLAGRLIPVRIEDCPVDGLIGQLVHADLAGLRDKEAASAALLEAVRAAVARRSKPLTEPDFPGPTTPAPPGFPVSPAGPPARSDYRSQVRQIAPPELEGRDDELAAMTAFCTDAAAGPYVWWRAAAWTGKTALMAGWVLRPPAGVRVVSFFITARYAGSSDRAAYVEVVTEQLAALLGQTPPSYLTEAARERLYWSLLEQAADLCRRNGQRLILVVDGLDEDRGRTTGPDALSIAALLPARPPAGMRVIVAGRPDPPLPVDVPARHPLRDPDVVWLLRRSDKAAAVAADMLADLVRLRDGTAAGRDVLGLVTAAGGGLTSRDLAELGTRAGHDVTEWDVDRLMATVAGRSFATRGGTGGHPVYVLGHEEIQQEAARSYGPDGLAAYRERLHAWAEAYRERGWPGDTPEYLLRGYYRLLLDTGDLVRATACVTDLARHDRMLDVSGGDTTALTEITDLQNAVLAGSAPDLPVLGRIAVHRSRIAGRNSNVPAKLAVVWARLGHLDRAEALAGSLPRTAGGVAVWIDLAGAALAAGRPERAVDLVLTVRDRLARSATPGSHDGELAVLAVRAGRPDLAAEFVEAGRTGRAAWPRLTEALLAAGGAAMAKQFIGMVGEPRHGELRRNLFMALIDSDPSEAVHLVRANPAEWWGFEAWERLFSALVRTGRSAEAEQLLDTGEFARRETGALLAALAAAGDRERLGRVAAKVGEYDFKSAAMAEALLRGRPAALAFVDRVHPEQRAPALISLIGAGTKEDRAAYADAALTVIRSSDRSFTAEMLFRAAMAADLLEVAEKVPMGGSQPNALLEVTKAWAAKGRTDEAVRVARTVTGNHNAERAWSVIARHSAAVGDWAAAEAALSGIMDKHRLGEAAGDVAEAMARSGAGQEAEAFTRRLPSSVRRAVGSGLLRGLVADGRYDHAERSVAGVEDDLDRHTLVKQLVVLLAAAGQHSRSEQLVPRLPRWQQAEILAQLAEVRHDAGDAKDAIRLALNAESAARHGNPYRRGRELYDLCIALIRIGECEEARRVAVRIDHPLVSGRRLACHLLLACRAGDTDRVADLCRQGDQAVAGTVTDTTHRMLGAITEVLLDLTTALQRGVRLLVEAGRQAEAEAIFRDTRNADLRERILRALVVATSAAGDHDRAESLVALTEDRSERLMLAGRLVADAASAGDTARAERMARTAATDCRSGDPLVRLATALARQGDRPGGLALMREAETLVRRHGISGKWQGWQESEALAVAYAVLGDDDAADAVIDQSQSHHVQVRQVLVEEYVRDRRFDRAMRLLETAGDPLPRTLLAAAVTSFASAGRFDLAEAAAAKAATQGAELAVLGALATACATPDRLGRLRDIAGRVEAIADQATEPAGRTLATVADGLAGLGENAHSHRLLARSLVDDSWAEWLDVIGRISPETLLTMARAA